MGGIAIAQGGHAYLEAYKSCIHTDPARAQLYNSDGIGTKVALKAKNLHVLLRAQREAEAAGIPCALITDTGNPYPPHFDGSATITALGIGPAQYVEIDRILRRFELFRMPGDRVSQPNGEQS